MEDIPYELRIICQTIAQGKWERQHPLPYRDPWKHAIHKVRRGVGHPPTATGGTKAPSLTGKSHNPVLTTVIAVHAQEAVSQNPALQKRAHLSLDEAGNRTVTLLLPGQESLKMIGDDTKENIFPRITGAVTTRGVTNRPQIALVGSSRSLRTSSSKAEKGYWHIMRTANLLWLDSHTLSNRPDWK